MLKSSTECSSYLPISVQESRSVTSSHHEIGMKTINLAFFPLESIGLWLWGGGDSQTSVGVESESTLDFADLQDHVHDSSLSTSSFVLTIIPKIS